MIQNTTHSFDGSGLKYLLEITAPGFSMHNDNFFVVLKQNTIEKKIEKNEFVEETVVVDGNEKHNFYMCFDSTLFQPGIVVCVVTAFVPDTDFPGGTRKEIDKFDLTILDPV